MNNYTLALIHLKGWTDAAGSRPMNPVYLGIDDGPTKAVYEEGYVLGQADRRRISDYTAAKFQVTFHEISAQ